ncbi:uncharacterized protein LOC127284409 [Leptopilina boulardi]|uniref:uncharacterized protein LOC127284409 n=1 Tax=Leptopilina boulardi TaxID=63433 RepID=UPI0021F57A1A|nr:uncharacterized protein LOC127284409 [Leptopilina boulardi]
MPTFYGEDCQTMNNHNLSHVADDVDLIRKSLSSVTAFPFENCLGLLKSMIKGPNDIVPQLIQRISEIENCPESLEEFKLAINCPVQRKQNSIQEETDKSGAIVSLTLRQMKIRNCKPDNTVILKDNTFFEVTGFSKSQENNISIEGHKIEDLGNSFDFPCDSSILGIRKLGLCSTKKESIDVQKIKNKCVSLEVKEERHALNLLHID